MRILVGGIAGGVVVFAWGALSHMSLGLFDDSFKRLPDEAALVSYVKSEIKEPGLYDFPWVDHGEEMDAAAEAAWKARFREGPNGLLLVMPSGDDPMSPRQLSLEFVSNVLGALVVAAVIALMDRVGKGLVSKTMMGAVLGGFAWCSQNASYWIWYRFPQELCLPELYDALASWGIAAAVMAFIVKKK